MLSTVNSPDESSSPRRPETQSRFRSRREEFNARPKLSAWRAIPRHHRILGVLLVLFILVASFHEQLLELYDWLQPPLAQVTLVDVAGQPIQMRGVADVFETDRSHYRASPMPLLGTVTLDSSVDSLVIDSNRYPKSVQVRIHVPGYGMDYISVELNRRHTWTLRLGPPTDVSGIVLDQTGAPVPGAQVIVLGGSNRGVELARVLTRADGKYTAHGISRNVDFLTLRVLKEGFALKEREHWLDASPGEKASQTDFKLAPVPELPEGGD